MGVRFELYEEKEKEMNVEQLRDEVVRIDKRIEEAKKDIENAEKERRVLVENLREKGFELTQNEDSSEDVEHNNIAETGKTQHGKTSLGRPVKVNQDEVKAWRQANNASISQTAKHFEISEASVKRACSAS